MNKRAIIEISNVLNNVYGSTLRDGGTDMAMSAAVVKYLEKNNWTCTDSDITQAEYRLCCYLNDPETVSPLYGIIENEDLSLSEEKACDKLIYAIENGFKIKQLSKLRSYYKLVKRFL